jgi:hypothetical protein
MQRSNLSRQSRNAAIRPPKAGNLGLHVDDPARVHFWVKRKQPRVSIPEGMSQFETEPDTFEELGAAVAATRAKRAQT